MLSLICRAGSVLALAGCLLGSAFRPQPSLAYWPPSSPQFTISSSWPANIQGFLRLETSQTLYDVLYHYGQNTPAANGAYGANVSAPRSAWYLEEQRAGGVDVIAGVLRQDTSLIQLGLKMYHFGLAREAQNGSFPGQMWPFHDTAMFLAEAAPSLIVLQYSTYASQFSSDISWDITRMNRAALHMVRAVGGPGHIDDSTKNHRFYEAALALDAVSILAHDPTLHTWSKVYAKLAIDLERPDGIMPEDNGHDTGYQALGMTYAARLLELEEHSLLAGALYRTLQRGEEWELSRVQSNGTVDQSGDTRTVGCKERNVAGQCKSVFYAPIFNALARWAVISGSAQFQHAAHQVWLRQQA